MKRIIVILMLSILILCGCTKIAQENKINVIDLADSGLFRESSQKDENGFYVRPFTKAGVIFTLNEKPDEDAQVTIVPIGVDIESFNEKIQRVQDVNVQLKDNKTQTVYNIFIEGIVNNDVLESMPFPERRDDAPFDVVCIYPAVETATALDIKAADVNALPEKEIEDIKALIDVNHDSKADIAIIEDQNEYTVSRYYVMENGAWKLLKEVLPM